MNSSGLVVLMPDEADDVQLMDAHHPGRGTQSSAVCRKWNKENLIRNSSIPELLKILSKLSDVKTSVDDWWSDRVHGTHNLAEKASKDLFSHYFQYSSDSWNAFLLCIHCMAN